MTMKNIRNVGTTNNKEKTEKRSFLFTLLIFGGGVATGLYLPRMVLNNLAETKKTKDYLLGNSEPNDEIEFD